MDEAIEFEKGHLKSRGKTFAVKPLKTYGSEEIRKLRLNLELSQLAFAGVFGVSKKTVEAWEAGKNEPSGPAKRMLEIITKDVTMVRQFIQMA